MISYAKKEDLDQIKALWKECFPGDDDFTKYFFENLFKIYNTLVLKTENKIVAMLQMLPFESSLGSVTYIYGVATANEHRKKGYAQQLIYKSFEESIKRGHEFSVLIPAEPWLFDFYKKYGYETKFYLKNEEIKTENPINISSCLLVNDYDDFINIYENGNMGEFFIKRDFEYFKHQLNIYKTGALKYMENSKIIGYSFGYYKDDIYHIDEIFAKDIEKCLKSFSNVCYKTLGNDNPIGVIKTLKTCKEPNSGYLNLMYN